jgi:hypothetical protein
VTALHLLVVAQHHVVAQVVETELGIGAVGDVGQVRVAAGVPLQTVLKGGHRKPQKLVDRAHPSRVAGGQVVVDRDHVHAFASKGIEVHGQGSDQGLAFAGLHLGNGALVQDDGAHDLHVKGAHARGALGRLARDREGLGHEVLKGLALGYPLLELAGLAPQGIVGERGDLGLERGHPGHRILEQPELLAFAEAKHLVNDVDHEKPIFSSEPRSARNCHRGGGRPLPSRRSRSW